MKITVCPGSLIPGYDTYSPTIAHSLFNGKTVSPFLDFSFDKESDSINVFNNAGRISVSGVQEKSAAIVVDGKIRLTKLDERSTHILKPAPGDFGLIARKQIPANEHLTMQIAKQVYGIVTADNALCFDAKGQAVYITKRFDILENGIKLQMEDFASLCGRNEKTEGSLFKYDASYEEIANAIKRYVATWPIVMERFFRILIFNYIYGNGDAHLKNFSLIKIDNEIQFAPAYDLLNTALHISSDDFGLKWGLFSDHWKSDTYERTGHPCKSDFKEFGTKIGISPKRLEKIINEFSAIPLTVTELIGRSFLDKKMQRKYIAIINQRTSRYNRE